jgi:hypothetical protein
VPKSKPPEQVAPKPFPSHWDVTRTEEMLETAYDRVMPLIEQRLAREAAEKKAAS